MSALARRRADAGLWAAFALVLALKLLFVSDHGTNDMDVALGWGHALLRHGLVDGYTGSNFPIAFQVYEALVWMADHLGIGEYAAMKGLDLACDLATFWALRALLRAVGANPRWAFAYWLSPLFLEMSWLGYDHFQMGLLVVVLLLLIVRADRAGTTTAWALAAVAMGVGFLQRPQFQALFAVLAVFGAIVAVRRLRRGERLRAAVLNAETRPVLWLLGGAVALFAANSLWFWASGRDALFLARSYATVSSFSPAFSANMLNVWAMVAEAYRHRDQQLPQISHPSYWHQVAALLGLATLLAGTWVISRRSEQRPFAVTALYLFAFASVALPNVYTRAHENHFFLGALLLVPLVALSRRRAGLLAALAATSALQAFNMFALYGFGLVAQSSDPATVDVRSVWTWGVRFAAAGVCTALFLAIIWLLRPLAGRAGDAPAPAG